MNFDFDTLVNRNDSSLVEQFMDPAVRAHGGVSFNGAEPLYKTAPAIRNALIAMAENGRIGFTLMDDRYRNAVIWWMENVRGFKCSPDWIVPTLGTIHSVATAIKLLTVERESIIITSPMYNRYEQAARRLERNAVKCPLALSNGRYRMDFDAIDKAMSRTDTKLFILCNPHNPIGQIYGREELETLAELSQKHGMVVFSDEIFAENSLFGNKTESFLTVPKAETNCIVATSMGKAFGTTGFNHANMIIPDKRLREAFEDRRTREHYGSMDPVAYECLLAGYSQQGKDWIDASNKVLEANIEAVLSFFAENLPDVPVYGGDGGYILWADWRSRFQDEEALFDFLHHKAFLNVDAGSHYYSPIFTRFSLACPTRCVRSSLEDLFAAI
ncbi:MAG: aminotransferase class I/II-fold pyridoxal phosphate-dependent enzyme [Clostridiales bacterium]|jgi:cystathionine beta-lyase|nr:aminotransferase class I/II-fold pyridoxal phosphate-dependent enzyme [Clostridiales bacterium]